MPNQKCNAIIEFVMSLQSCNICYWKKISVYSDIGANFKDVDLWKGEEGNVEGWEESEPTPDSGDIVLFRKESLA